MIFERYYLEEQLKDSEFREEYEALEPEYTIMQATLSRCIHRCPLYIDGYRKMRTYKKGLHLQALL